MTTISPLAASSSRPAKAERARLDQDAFLRLMVEQLRTQDPTSPMQTGEYMAQLASFTSVEQAVQQNAKLDRLLETGRISQAAGLIGHAVTSADGKTTGTVVEVRVDATGLTAVLRDGTTIAMGDGVTISK